MQAFLLIFSDHLSASETFERSILQQFSQLGLRADASLKLREDAALLDSLLWVYEAPWRRLIAIADESTFASLNRALSSTLGLELAICHDELAVSCARWVDNAACFKASVNSQMPEREFILIRQSAYEAFSAELCALLSCEDINAANLAAPCEAQDVQCEGLQAYKPEPKSAEKASAKIAHVLGMDAQSARILLGPAASSSRVNLRFFEPTQGLCSFFIEASEFSDAAGFCQSAAELFQQRFIAGDLYAALVRKLASSGRKIACAESCTAGQFAAKIAGVEGASGVFVGGFVPYLRAAKRAWLGVRNLKDAAVYSELCARELASAAAAKSGADIGVGITGVLGASSDCGVERGTVSICVRFSDGVFNTQNEREICERISLNAPRALMQEQAALAACAICLRLLS